MPFDIRQFNKRVLLTGAGLSRNWGGRLAREMWEEIFSHPAVQLRPALRMLLVRTPLFEDALTEIRGPKYRDEDQAAMNSAIREAFERMDAEHVAQLPSQKIDDRAIREFLGRFYSVDHRVGYIFSLNQDALVELLAGLWADLLPGFSLPGIRLLPPLPMPAAGRPRFAYPATPDMSEIGLEGNLNYIKLHASFLWHPEDGSPGMVLGGGKEIKIGRSPLLTWYYQLFNQVLCSGDVRLLVIGYSFKDEHINRIIWTAAQSFGARIFIWDTTHSLELVEKVGIADRAFPTRCVDLRPFLCGAASRPLVEVFPCGAHPTPEWKRIAASFFS